MALMINQRKPPYLKPRGKVTLWYCGFSDVCMICYCTGAKKIPSESNIDIESKVDLHDGDDGGIVMEVHRKRGTFLI